ncbi:MAG: toll/interleukin-1 receptor domain-containing protein, partial [Pseudomonadota bacterium]
MSERRAVELRNRDWEILLSSIESGNCVLLLGPNLDVAIEGGAEVNLCAELATTLQEELAARAPVNGNFSLIAQLFENELSRDELMFELVRFYRDQAEDHATLADPAFAALASIPFRTFLSLRHDSTLERALTQAGRTPSTDYYDFKGGLRDTIFADKSQDHASNWGTVERPLVYKLLGTLEPDHCRGSAVITENDHIRFLEAVVSENPKLPTDLTNYLNDKNFLFVGFGMQNFYLRILLHVLNVARSKKSFAFEGPMAALREASAPSHIDESVLFFRSTGFDTLKIMETDPSAFLCELAQRWDAKFPQGSYVAPVASNGARKPAQGPSVFISYVSEDEDRAQELTRILTSEGLEPWLDKDGLRVGDRWNDRLEDTISADVDFFIVLQSRALTARRESYVHQEVNLALERQRMR